MSHGNCNMSGGCANGIISALRPDIDIFIFRDASPNVEEIYFGDISGVPNLGGYRIIDMQYDFYNCIFSIEVK